MKKILGVLSSVLLTVPMLFISFSSTANAVNQTSVNYKTNKDFSETVISVKDNNSTHKYTIKSNGGGMLEETSNNGFCVSAEIDDNSKLPENIQIADIETIYKAPEINGDYLCFDDGKAIMTLEKAEILAEQLHDADGISNIQIYQQQNSRNCYLYQNWYSNMTPYEFDVNDFTEIIEKGFDVSLHEYGYISIIPPEFDVNDDIGSANYQGMLAAMEIQESKGIELLPYIYCETSDDISYEKFCISGDLNNDYVVNAADIVVLQKLISNKEIPVNNINIESADVNNDGDVNVFDAVSLKRKLLDM